jgi:hypothetical protein
MEKYDYYKSVKEDIKQRLNDWFDFNSIDDYSDIDEVINAVYDDFFNSDSITGNGSGSYTFNSWKAEENLCHNMDLLKEALDEFGGDFKDYIESAESCDVVIRCYVFGQLIGDVVKEFVEEKFPDFEF